MSQDSTVFVLDASPETVEVLCGALEEAGLRTAGVSEPEVRLNQANFEAMVRVHRPSAIVFDVPGAAPDEWAFLAHVRRTPPCRDIPLVLTTSETRSLRHVFRFHSSEILDKPYELSAVVAAVERAVSGASREAGTAPDRAEPFAKGRQPGGFLAPRPAGSDAGELSGGGR